MRKDDKQAMMTMTVKTFLRIVCCCFFVVVFFALTTGVCLLLCFWPVVYLLSRLPLFWVEKVYMPSDKINKNRHAKKRLTQTLDKKRKLRQPKKTKQHKQ